MVTLADPILVSEVRRLVSVRLDPIAFNGQWESRLLNGLDVLHILVASTPDRQETRVALEVTDQSFIALATTAVLSSPESEGLPGASAAGVFVECVRQPEIRNRRGHH
jgi:hypothetical protein